MLITKFPDVMGKFSYILVIGISKWCFVIPPSCFEITLSHSIVVFGGQIFSWYRCFINYAFCKTGTIERAFITFATIALFTSVILFSITIENFCIMATNNRCHIVHAVVIKHLPMNITERLSSISCNKDEFNKSKPIYAEALKKSGFDGNMSFIDPATKKNKRKRIRKNIIWFNPPFDKNVTTNVAKRFLQLIDKHFPKGHALHKLFNRNTVKVSYSCMNNMASIISGHNAKILNSNIQNFHLTFLLGTSLSFLNCKYYLSTSYSRHPEIFSLISLWGWCTRGLSGPWAMNDIIQNSCVGVISY